MSTKKICDICQRDATTNISFGGSVIDVCPECQRSISGHIQDLILIHKRNKVSSLPRKPDGKGV